MGIDKSFESFIVLAMKTSQPKANLSGLRPIRESLGISASSLAHLSGIHVVNVRQIENVRRGVSVASLRRLADSLSCTTDDLFSQPSPQRLLEIRAAFLEREAARARAAAQEVA